MNKVTADTAIKLVAANNYISYNKFIAKKFGLEATIVFGELCSIANIYNDKEFYCLKEQIEEDTCLAEDAVRRAIRFLALCGAITITKKGIPCKNYYTINIQTVCNILNNDDWVKPVDEVEERRKQKRKEKRDKETQVSKSYSNSDINTSSDRDVIISSGVNVTTSRDGDVTTSSGDDVTTTFKKTIRETIKDNINLNYNSFSSSCDSDISQNTDTKKLSSQSHDYSDNFPEENQETEISEIQKLKMLLKEKEDVINNQEKQLKDCNALIAEQNFIISDKNKSKKAKNSYEQKQSDEFYKPILQKYKQVFFEVNKSGIPLIKDYKKYTDNAVERLLELNYSLDDIQKIILQAFNNAKSCDFWLKNCKCSFAYVVSEVGLSKLTGDVSVNNTNSRYNFFVDKDRDYTSSGGDW